MRKSTLALLSALPLLFAACTFVPKVGMKENKWLRNTVASDLVYLEGNVKAYRSGGAYYYFKDGALLKVSPSLLKPNQLPQ